MIEALSEYRFPLDDMVLCSLRVRLDEIAARLELPIHEWEEDGLGPARASGCRLPSGLAVVLQEYTYAVELHGMSGPNVLVDVGEIATHGIARLVDEVVDALSLSRTELGWVQPAEADGWAKENAERARLYHTARQERNQTPPA